MLNRVFTLLQAYSGVSVEEFSEKAGLTTERFEQLRKAEAAESRTVDFKEVLGVARAVDLRLSDVIRLNEYLRLPSTLVDITPEAPQIIATILTNYRAAYDEQRASAKFFDEGPSETVDAFIRALPPGHSTTCEIPQILYLDDRRDPEETLSDQKILSSSILLVRGLAQFHKAIRAGYTPNEVHFDGILSGSERGIHAAEELAHEIVDGKVPLNVSVYFHSSDPSENEKMKKIFFGILEHNRLRHHQQESAETKKTAAMVASSKSALTGLRAQIARQKNKGKR